MVYRGASRKSNGMYAMRKVIEKGLDYVRRPRITAKYYYVNDVNIQIGGLCTCTYAPIVGTIQ